MLKILYVSASIIPSKNANSVHVMKMNSALKGIVSSVTLVATKGKHVKSPFEKYNVEKKFRLVLSKEFGMLSSYFRLIESFKNLENIDLVFTRWLIAAVLLPLKYNGPMIMEFHSYPTSYIQRKLLTMHLQKSRKIKYIFITEALKEDFLTKHPILKNKEVIVLPDGADTNSEISVQKMQDKVRCCYIGSFLEGKGVDTVVEIANKLQDIEFHIVGGDETSINILRKKAVYNNIKWYGYKNQKDAMKILEKCQIALLPNKPNVFVDGNKDIGSWTSPLKLFEYMAYGKGIIASDISVLKEILVDHENALLVEPLVINEWVEAILELAKNEDLYEKIAYNAKSELEENYSWTKRAEKILEWSIK